MSAAEDRMHWIVYRYVSGSITDTNLGERQFRGNAGSSELQSDGYALDLQGGDLSRMQGGPLLWSHGQDGPDPIVGAVKRMTATATELPFLAEFLPAGVDAMADQLCDKVKAGAPYGMSLGFEILERVALPDGTGYRATSWRALELSLCTVAVDPSARITARAEGSAVIALTPNEQASFDRARSLSAWVRMRAVEERYSYARRQTELERLRAAAPVGYEEQPAPRRRMRPYGL